MISLSWTILKFDSGNKEGARYRTFESLGLSTTLLVSYPMYQEFSQLYGKLNVALKYGGHYE